MKTFLKYMICCLLPFIAVSCVQEEIAVAVNEDIVLSFDSGVMTKAVADTDVEAYVSHVDVVIFDEDGNGYYHERVNNAGQTTFTLSKKRSEFTSGTAYYVYLIANSTLEADKFASAADVDALKSLTQTDENIMFTGLPGMPEHFLMDAVAYTDATEPQTPGKVVINDGVVTNSTQLNAVFRRAASKIFVTILKGDDVDFAESTAARYYMRNCPVQTTVAEGYNINPTLFTPGAAVLNDNFRWSENTVTVTAYAYAYDWDNQSVQDKETSLVVNIPLTYDGILYTNSWYKIPVSQTSDFERNHHYAVTVTVDAPGAENQENPVELEGMKYDTLPWEDVNISVGDQTNQPKYLQLSTNHVDMYNVDEDDTSLSFASSSEISIDLVRAYYYNKHGEQISVSGGGSIYAASESGALNGPVTIVSPMTESGNLNSYNTIRYLEFKVTNQQGLTDYFTVQQFPVIYVTNSLGWYSYRKDFKDDDANPTTYQYKGDRIVSVSLNITGNGAYDWSNSYSTERGSGYWYSKVRVGNNSTGTTQYSSYGWGWSDDSPTTTNSWYASSTNLRMYHVNVTTTSSDYIISRPKMTYDDKLGLTVTDPGEDNKKLVSPSFMIASRLGFFTTNAGNINNANDAQRLEIFRVHCANYVEVHGSSSNPIVYDNWRLPTEAELKIIMDLQGEQNENAAAVDYLLNAGYYFGAHGPVWNSKNDDDILEGASTSSKSVRCVRDAY